MAFKAGDPRRTQLWRRIAALTLSPAHLICRRCGQPIDKTLRHPHPYSAQAGHIVNVDERPDLALDISNVAPEHRRCNIRAENERRKHGTPSTSRHW